MGELHVNMNITMDGVIQANGGPSDQDEGFEYPGWETLYRTAEAGAQIIADVQQSDALLLGRITYELFASYWPGKTDDIGVAFDAVPKYLASRSTPEHTWANTTQLVDAAAALPGLLAAHRQIHTWGSADLLQSLFTARLVDQLNLWVYPVVLGTGKKLFPNGVEASAFELVEPPRSFGTGVMLVRYRCLKQTPASEA